MKIYVKKKGGVEGEKEKKTKKNKKRKRVANKCVFISILSIPLCFL
jgi:hypothetical protein